MASGMSSVFSTRSRGREWQVELTDKWLQYGNPWEVVRPEIAYEVKFGGRTEYHIGPDDRYQVNWVPGSEVKGTAYDSSILGYQGNAPF
jgi:starch phosphorylase